MVNQIDFYVIKYWFFKGYVISDEIDTDINGYFLF